jgi:Spy/CpxP family protein refolding chaperone
MKKILILLGLAIVCFAQPFDDQDPRAIIEKVKIYRLTQELDLTSEQAVVFFPKLNELQKIEREFGEGKKEIIDELKKLVADNAPEEKILEQVAKYEKLHKDKLTKQMNKIKELWKILTPLQRAKFLIFQEEFNKEIREMIKKIKKQREP